MAYFIAPADKQFNGSGNIKLSAVVNGLDLSLSIAAKSCSSLAQ